MNLAAFIARRYLVSKKSYNAINIISIISVVGIAVGTMALVIVLSALNGITGLVFSLYNVFDPDVKILPKEGKVVAVSGQMISALEGYNYSFVMEEKALLRHGDKQTIATIKGVDENFVKLARFDTVVYPGSFRLESDSVTYSVLGCGIADKLGIYVGEGGSFSMPLQIYFPKKENTAVLNPEDAFSTGIVYPSGTFSLNDDFDFTYVLLPLDYVRELLQAGEKEVSAVEITAPAGKTPDELAEDLKQKLGDGFKVKTRYELNEVLFRTMKSEKWWTFLILAFILVIGTFNVIGSLTMLIIEKKKDIGILSTMGADESLIRKIFMTEGFYITLIGAVAGLALGLLICFLQIRFKLVPFNEGFVIDAYPITIIPMDILYIFLTVMAIGFFASWYPVRLFTRRYFG
ncbi:MAG: FtsX-like permease family protein [Bacteroidota bacterium]